MTKYVNIVCSNIKEEKELNNTHRKDILGFYPIVGQTMVMPSSEPEIRKESSAENDKHVSDL